MATVIASRQQQSAAMIPVPSRLAEGSPQASATIPASGTQAASRFRGKNQSSPTSARASGTSTAAPPTISGTRASRRSRTPPRTSSRSTAAATSAAVATDRTIAGESDGPSTNAFSRSPTRFASGMSEIQLAWPRWAW